MTEIFNTHKAVDQLEKDQTSVGRIIGVTISNSLLKRLGGGLTIVTHGEESRQIEFQLTLAQMPLPAPPKPQDGTVVERIMQQKDKRVGLSDAVPPWQTLPEELWVSTMTGSP